MNSKKFGSKVKGFTLVEMLIVMAIIGILAGMISLFVGGFQRDARIESNNNKAQLVYTAFQNILINCEIEQDDEVFDIGRFHSTAVDADLEYLVFQFGMSNAKVDDRITVIPQYVPTASINSSPLGAERNSSDEKMKEYFGIAEKAITSYLDSSFEGYAVVYIDFKNYVVDSVIYFEPNVIPSPVTNYADDVGQYLSGLSGYADEYKYTTGSQKFRMLNSIADQKKYYKYVGSHLGAYPKVDDFASGTAPAKVS